MRCSLVHQSLNQTPAHRGTVKSSMKLTITATLSVVLLSLWAAAFITETEADKTRELVFSGEIRKQIADNKMRAAVGLPAIPIKVK